MVVNEVALSIVCISMKSQTRKTHSKTHSKGSKRIYLDYASVTPIDNRVQKEYEKYSSIEYANPSSLHTEGVQAKKVMDASRKQIAELIHGHTDEITFTASGTEANNLAIVGVVEKIIADGKKYADLHIITSVIEHASVLEPIRMLEKKGVQVTYVPVDKDGIIDLHVLKTSLKPHTVLVSIMMVNNEIGTIQPLYDIAKLVRHARKENIIAAGFPYLHTDACQAPLYLPLDVRSLGVDLLTLDAQKMYGPRGNGLLWTRRGTEVVPIISGGGQEKGLRSATPHVASIAAFAKAFSVAAAEQSKEAKRIQDLRTYFIRELQKIEAGIVLNGHAEKRIANNVNVSIPGIDNEFYLLQLDAKGIACSTKSSCLRDEDESYVIKALGADSDRARNSLRFTLGRMTKRADIDFVLKAMKTMISLRQNGRPQQTSADSSDTSR